MSVKDEVLTAIGQMNVMDLVDLVHTLEEEFGIKAVSAVVPVQSSGPVEAPVVEEEQTEFTVRIKESVPREKLIAVLKAIRTITPLGLREAKELVESAPVVITEGVSKDEAESVASVLTAAGAVTEVS